jgi:hypothetical protein
MLKLARTISLALGYPWLIAIIWIILHYTGLSPAQLVLFRYLTVTLQVIIPFSFLFWALRSKRISDIDITKRSERFELLTLIFIGNTLTLVAAWLYATPLLFQVFLGIYAVFAAVYFITLFWKISMHMTLNTLGITVINILMGWQHVYLFALIPVVFWSRRILRKHTLTQLCAGFLVPFVVLMAVYWYYGLI